MDSGDLETYMCSTCTRIASGFEKVVPESSPNLFNLVALGGLCLDDW